MTVEKGVEFANLIKAIPEKDIYGNSMKGMTVGKEGETQAYIHYTASWSKEMLHDYMFEIFKFLYEHNYDPGMFKEAHSFLDNTHKGSVYTIAPAADNAQAFAMAFMLLSQELYPDREELVW